MMPVSLAILLCLSLVALSVAHAVAVYFICNLVSKVTKLKASASVYDYRALMKEESGKDPDTDDYVPPQEPVGDGTLNTPEAITHIREQL